jgi:hypothetical protein
MKLARYYRNAVLIPAGIVLAIMFVYSIMQNQDYVSEWFTAEGVIIISIIYALIYSIIISISALTIFLNKIVKVKQNFFLSFFSWFLLPFGLITTTWIHDVKNSLKYDQEYSLIDISNFIMTAPFFVGLILSFIKFRKNNYRQHRV